MSEPLVRVEGLKIHYPIRRGALVGRTVGHIRAVDGVDFEIAPGETLGLVGESGCGKSSVGRALLGIERPAGGSIRFAGEEISRLGRHARRPLTRRMQMVFQDSYASLDPRMRVAALIEEPLVIHRTLAPAARRARVAELLDLVGLPAAYGRLYAHQLSGGQRQRVGIARALALNPDFLVCDEPVSALDVSIQAQIINLLKRLQAELGLTYLFIAHDIAAVRFVADRMLVMYLGRMMETGPSDAVVAEPLHPYTRALMRAVPIPDPRLDRARHAGRAATISGEALPLPTGCRFAHRCPEAARVRATRGIDCAVAEPPAYAIGVRRVACHLYGDGAPA